MRDERRDRRIAEDRGAEIVEREAIAGQGAQQAERRRAEHQPARRGSGESHPPRQRPAVLRA